MGSIMLNGQNEIGLGYSVSSTTVYPGIRYCGQSAAAYAAATGTMDIPEEVIQTGTISQTAAERWGDYSALQVDPSDDATFWFTSEYIGSGETRNTKIASFNFVTLSNLWTGAVSGAWSEPSNWSTGSVPGSSSLVIIPSSAPTGLHFR